ncbi:MAG: hypothetical protein K0U68_16105 [Gammaproteobacteria bacterium]|nr:hypothetical protein [Gammaproteobacteria bacterium]
MIDIQIVFIIAVAIGLPWLVGSQIIFLIYTCCREKPSAPIVIGYGYLFGLLTTTLLLRCVGISNFLICLVLSVICLVLGFLSYRRSNFSLRPASKLRHVFFPNIQNLNILSRLLLSSIVILIVLHVYLAATTILLKPLYAWDAWATWSVKSRTWFELKQVVDFVGREQWLNGKNSSLFVLDAWHYPDSIPLTQTWIATMLDFWNDSLVNIPWLFCLLAFGLGFWGQIKQLKIKPELKIITIYLVISLPMINVHTALAGYSDLWLSCAYTFAALALIQYLITQSVFQLVISALAAICVSLIKVEGVVLCASLLCIWLLSYPFHAQQIRPRIIFGLMALFVIGFLVVTAFSPINIDIPYLGSFSISYHSVWKALAINYFVLPNWNLLIYIVMTGILVCIFSPHLTSQGRRLILTPITILLLYVFVLFFLTQNYTWAEHYSSINRITLHLIPTVLFCLVLFFDKRFQNRHMLGKTA